MKRGRARKPEGDSGWEAKPLEERKKIAAELAGKVNTGPNPELDELLQQAVAITPHIPQVNDVIQAIKGDNYGRLGIIARIDPDCYKCYVIERGGTRAYFDVLPDEIAIIGKVKKAIKDPIPEHPLPSSPETPTFTGDTIPFGGFKK